MRKPDIITLKCSSLMYGSAKQLLPVVSIAVLVFLLYLPSLDHGFINWDDPLYVYENPDIGNYSFDSIAKLFTTVVSSNWHPLTMLSLQLDYQIWGMNPKGYHLTNVILHTLNCLFVFFLSLRLIRSLKVAGGNSTNNAIITATITAILFGVHPLHVESVAWISERKDLLYSLFFLLSILFYLRFIASKEKREWRFYVISILFYGFSLMSKPMAVTLPLILLIMDVYPLQRLNILSSPRPAVSLLVEKIPYFLLAFLTSIATIWAQQSGGAIKSVAAIPVLTRFAVAIRAYIFYIIKTILPFNLAPLYPHPAISNFDIPNIHFAVYFIVFLSITVVCVKTFRTKPFFSAFWLYYIITLAPVVGIIHVGGQAAADRYMYMASIAPFLLTGFGVMVLIDRMTKVPYRFLIITVLLLFITFQVVQARKQLSIWQDSVTLWNHEISIFPEAEALPYFNRGKALDEMGKSIMAIKDYDQAIAINSSHTAAYDSRGIVFGKLGNYEKALADFSKAIALDPALEKAYSNRGMVYHILKQYDLAKSDYHKAIALNPSDRIVYNNLSLLYNELGDIDKAAAYAQKFRELSPKSNKRYE